MAVFCSTSIAQHMHVKNGCVHAPAYPQAKVKKEEYVEGHINL